VALFSTVIMAMALFLWPGFSPLFAWEPFLQRFGTHEAPRPRGGLLLVDADDWTREELVALARDGRRPTAWLNVGKRETGRSFSLAFDTKLLVVPKKGRPPEPAPVRFYQEAWKNLARARVRELAQKGCSGLCLSGLETAREITDHPHLEREMENFVGDLATEFRRFAPPRGQVLIHVPTGHPIPDGVRDHVDGIIIEGLWYRPKAGRVHPWERAGALRRLQAWREAGKEVFTLDFPCQPRREHAVTDETLGLGFDPAFAVQPLHIDRRKLP